jgi:hypothetical protein
MPDLEEGSGVVAGLREVVGCGQNSGGGEGWLGRVGGGGEEPALERSGDADPVVVSP